MVTLFIPKNGNRMQEFPRAVEIERVRLSKLQVANEIVAVELEKVTLQSAKSIRVECNTVSCSKSTINYSYVITLLKRPPTGIYLT